MERVKTVNFYPQGSVASGPMQFQQLIASVSSEQRLPIAIGRKVDLNGVGKEPLHLDLGDLPHLIVKYKNTKFMDRICMSAALSLMLFNKPKYLQFIVLKKVYSELEQIETSPFCSLFQSVENSSYGIVQIINEGKKRRKAMELLGARTVKTMQNLYLEDPEQYNSRVPSAGASAHHNVIVILHNIANYIESQGDAKRLYCLINDARAQGINLILGVDQNTTEDFGWVYDSIPAVVTHLEGDFFRFRNFISECLAYSPGIEAKDVDIFFDEIHKKYVQ